MSKKLLFIKSCIVVVFFILVAGLPYAATVTDHDGRRVNVPDNPRRVISLAPSITEIVFAVGRGDRLVAATMYSNYPGAAKQVTSVGSYVNLDIEKIVSLDPDLCIAIKDGNPISVIRRLEELDIPVYAVDPRDLDSVMASLEDIGSLLGADKQAGKVIANMKERMADVQERISKISHRPRVFFQIGVSPIVSAGSDTFIHELIRRAGGKNLAGGQAGYPRFSTEEVLAISPEIIIVTSMNRQDAFNRVFEKWKQWKDLPAAANDRIYLVDSDLVDRPSPRLVKGLEKLARLIHPELFNKDERN
ncbi:MAG: cobalamin-binding protein [Desulfobacteraceae bacterium]|nr:cobalamin-binding protein [Desulfobacteraceae bacterium]